MRRGVGGLLLGRGGSFCFRILEFRLGFREIVIGNDKLFIDDFKGLFKIDAIR